MAKEPESAGTPESPEEWDTIERGAPIQVVFDTIGDEFVGMYLGNQEITIPDPKPGENESFRQDQFEGKDGELYAINPGYQLKQVLDRVPINAWVRITYKRDVDTGQPAPMRSFQVDVRR